MRVVDTVVVAFVFGVSLVGCNNAPRPDHMVPDTLDLAQKHFGSVYVETIGGQPCDAWGGIYLDNAPFKQAIEQSVTKYQVFSSIAPAATPAPDYTLSVKFESDAPSWGMNMTVDHRAHWKLIQNKSQRTLLDEQIDNDSTATVGQAFAAAERRKLGIEQAAKLNIQTGLKRIGQLGF